MIGNADDRSGVGQKTENGQTTHYLIDPNRPYAQVLGEYDTAQNELAFYTYGDDLLAQSRSGQTRYYHYDGLGTTRALSDNTGVLTDSYAYEAFGELTGSLGTTENNYLFTGEQFDPGLDQYYLRARYYDPNRGGFTQMDNWMGNSQDPATLHKYLYANNNVANGTDPSGNMTLINIMGAANSRNIGRSISTNTLRRYGKKVISETIRDVGSAKRKVKECISNKKKNCDLDIPVLIVGGDRPDMADHIFDAQTGAGGTNLIPSGFLFSYSPRQHTQWYLGYPGCTPVDAFKAEKMHGPKIHCDEFPMNAMNRGGPRNHPVLVSLRYVPGGQNSSIGSMWKLLVNSSGMKADQRKKALVLAWREFPVSLWLP